ncbi:ATP-binding protein [Mesoterricola sediminis]|uniref:histidine kinase n=1 Tax=Mesoterricola sediminis TaxID=2927980 RepID=A0AA48H637_9BACT|nr:ATP-binding protein [Mesoterricola sediminis]BDU76663.1 two-component system sensor histidine kinase DcuS [Mesoterricola sediminis]
MLGKPLLPAPMPLLPTSLRLRTRILLLAGATVLVALLVTGLLVSWRIEARTRETLAEKARMVALLAAGNRDVVEALAGRGDRAAVQAFADRTRQETGIDYLVVLDMNHTRVSHPNPARIGDRFQGGDEAGVYEGRTYASVAKGTLGPALRVFAPVRDRDGRQVGAVAAGVLLRGVDTHLHGVRRLILAGLAAGFAAGAAGAYLLAGQVRRILLGMEPAEIAALLHQRTAIVQSAREGILAVDRDMRTTVVNEEAERIFALAGLDTVQDGGLARVLATGLPERGVDLQVNGLDLLVDRAPVTVEGRVVGAVALFRERSEAQRLAEQLTGARLYADALRAQTHEFMNRLHVILGLLRLGEHDRLAAYVTDLGDRFQGEVGEVTGAIKDPVLAGFLLARFSAARERGVAMRLACDTRVPALPSPQATHHLVTLLGNALENAVEALEGAARREIAVDLAVEDGRLRVTVLDSGPGLPPVDCFAKGASTKGPGRGFGLFNARRAAEALGGTVALENAPGGGARFTADLPLWPPETAP